MKHRDEAKEGREWFMRKKLVLLALLLLFLGGMFSAASAVEDTTGPELISFRIVENGQTFTAGDVMHVEVKYSDESGIRIIQGFTSGPEGTYAEFRYNQEKELWEWSYTISQYDLNGEFKIRSIWAYDNLGNSSGTYYPDDYVILTGCTEKDTTGPELVSFRIVENGQTLTEGDTMHVEVKFVDASGIRIIQGFTSGPEGKYAEFRYNSTKDIWEWSFTITKYILNGEFKISTIWAYDNVGNNSGSFEPEDYVIVAGCTENDTTGPELLSFRIIENGQELTAGDTVHIEVKYSDPSGIRIIQGFTTGAKGKYAEFRYNTTKDLWEWSYTFNEYTQDGPFGIKTIWAYDNVGNSSGTYTPDDYVVFIDPFTRNLVIPENVTKIEAEAFYGSSMVVATINNNCNRIGDRAFANCKSLWRIYIPISVTSIGDDFLLGSTRATIYCEEGSEAARWAQSHSWPVVIQ